jgi:ubiquitin carboxyl-terminal hydrolase 10
LQLLVHSPPICNLFKELGDLKGQRGAAGLETGGSPTPLVDATVRFLEEYISKEKEPPSTQHPPQKDTKGKSREVEENKNESKGGDSFEPTYLYDAMKQNMRLRTLLVRSRVTWRPAVSDLC